jgi:phosphoribosylformylglycinamidine synthase
VDVGESRNIFEESQSRALLEVKPENAEAVAKMATDLGLQVEGIGQIGGDRVKVNSVEMPMDQLKKIYFGKFSEVIEQDL